MEVEKIAKALGGRRAGAGWTARCPRCRRSEIHSAINKCPRQRNPKNSGAVLTEDDRGFRYKRTEIYGLFFLLQSHGGNYGEN